MGPARKTAGLVLAVSGASALAASEALLFFGAEWIRPFFYLFAWWSYLAVAAGVNELTTGRSRLIHRPASYARLAIISVPFWLFYEAANLRLENWAYLDLVDPPWVRWPGYAFAYATVLPAVLETADLLRSVFRRLSQAAPAPKPVPQPDQPVLLRGGGWRWAGLACLALPLLWPNLFFPLIWAPAFLLLEPWVAKVRPKESWLSGLRVGQAGPAAALLLSGIACGLLWEFFNYWAGAKWIYIIPWPSGPKFFEMPLLGYLGFPPFALGCASFWHAFDAWWLGLGRPARSAWAAGLGLLCLVVFRMIDHWTVWSYAPF